jgi:hypothetical protein
MTFGLGVTQLNNRWAGVEASVVNQLSGQILSKNAQASVLSAANLAQFKRADLGVNLYGANNIDTQRQIASNNGVLNAINSPAVALLKAKAASTVYAPIKAEKAEAPTVETLTNNVFLQMTDKDKKGSNPFNGGKANQQETEQNLSLVA